MYEMCKLSRRSGSIAIVKSIVDMLTTENREMNWQCAPPYPSNRNTVLVVNKTSAAELLRGDVDHGKLENIVKPVRRDNVQHQM